MAAFPFSAIVGQDDLKRALLLASVDPGIGGVLAFGDRGTGKSTAIRALAALLPDVPLSDDPVLNESGRFGGAFKPAPVVDLPLGATEDRVVGALDLEAALVRGEKRFQLGLLADAHNGFLYIDEVNLLEDHLVDVLLDVAASGENVVEREGLSIRHAARFVLVGSGNPEEGDLRPQLLDRFGLAIDVRTPTEIAQRLDIITRRDAFETDREGFAKKWRRKDAALRNRIVEARERIGAIDIPESALTDMARLCVALGTDGLRGELTLMRAARADAALNGDESVSRKNVRAVATAALRHRLRKAAGDDVDAGARVARAVAEILDD
ncbi:MAG: magnesium chelatase ATPase subunit I [Alphaproteobacteria bacterium]|nr:magnesium chelatase ATPase subunit I [Alphaproteobacteria bacterium]